MTRASHSVPAQHGHIRPRAYPVGDAEFGDPEAPPGILAAVIACSGTSSTGVRSLTQRVISDHRATVDGTVARNVSSRLKTAAAFMNTRRLTSLTCVRS